MRHVESRRPVRRHITIRAALFATPLLAALALALVAPPAESSGTPSPPKDRPIKPEAAPAGQPPDSAAINAEARAFRARAEEAYAKGYAEAQEAKALQKAGKEKDAKKKFGKALGKFQGIVESHPDYYEAWNMLGFCARKTGDLKRAFSAYEKCLAINPEYEEAHEYLGEAYLMAGNPAKAKEQLAWLKSRNSEEAEELEEAIEAAAGTPAAPAPETSAK